MSGEIATPHGNQGMSDAPITFRFKGTAGQSFGVWNAGGLHLHLEGDANDYVGKGMTGGKIVITPPAGSALQSQESAIVGNTCLYGATGGKLFAAGTAGERFAVRNSGAHAVVEGTGDHCCEYMTGGFVCVLGKTGYNFGSGMTGGFAYVLDLDNSFFDRVNHELVDLQRISGEADGGLPQPPARVLVEYVAETGSAWGRRGARQPRRLRAPLLAGQAEGREPQVRCCPAPGPTRSKAEPGPVPRGPGHPDEFRSRGRQAWGCCKEVLI